MPDAEDLGLPAVDRPHKGFVQVDMAKDFSSAGQPRERKAPPYKVEDQGKFAIMESIYRWLHFMLLCMPENIIRANHKAIEQDCRKSRCTSKAWACPAESITVTPPSNPMATHLSRTAESAGCTQAGGTGEQSGGTVMDVDSVLVSYWYSLPSTPTAKASVP